MSGYVSDQQLTEAELDEIVAQCSVQNFRAVRGLIYRAVAELRTERAKIAAVRRVVDDLRRRENEMALVQGESPRPADYSEGHYNGVRHGYREASAALAAALAESGETE